MVEARLNIGEKFSDVRYFFRPLQILSKPRYEPTRAAPKQTFTLSSKSI